MRRQGIKSTIEKPQDTDLEYKSKKYVVFCTTVDPGTTKEGTFFSDICERFPTTPSRGNKYIYTMYIYGFNANLTTATKNRSDKGMIRAFTEFTEYLKIRRINS